MKTCEVIRNKLEQALKPFKLEIEDQSHLHKGHLDNPALLETHFKLLIVADCFTNITKVQRHRMIYKILLTELQQNIHALSMHTYTVNEFNTLKTSKKTDENLP